MFSVLQRPLSFNRVVNVQLYVIHMPLSNPQQLDGRITVDFRRESARRRGRAGRDRDPRRLRVSGDFVTQTVHRNTQMIRHSLSRPHTRSDPRQLSNGFFVSLPPR
jgi:hypothetical protein